MKPDQMNIAPAWEDLVFENRNKQYGAYAVRKSYTKHLAISVVTACLLLAMALLYPYIKKLFETEEVKDTPPTRTITINELEAPPPIQETPPPPKLDIPPPVKTIIKFLPPKVTEKEIVEEEEMPTIEEIKQNDTGAENVEGDGNIVFEEPVEEIVEENTDDMIFTVVEQAPEFEGGLQEMYKFMAKNTRYPAKARRMGIEGTVFIGFVVDAKGMISDVAIIKGIDTDCDAEAIRVVQMMPPWRPGKQNGKAVKVKYVLPFKFKLAI